MAEIGITFLYGQAVARCDHHIDKVFEGYCTLQYMASGVVALSLGGESHVLSGRYFWSCYPGPHIRFWAGGGTTMWDHHYLAFRGEVVERWRSEGLFPVPPQRPPHGEDYSSRFDELLALSRRADRWGIRRAVNLLEAMLIELAEARDRAPADAMVERAITVLHEAADDEAMSGEDLAGHLGVSERTLRRRFALATGHSPKAYLIQQRIAAARRLLAETDLPIKKIARQLGYKDVFFFTRQFTRTTGVAPGKYRRSCAG